MVLLASLWSHVGRLVHSRSHAGHFVSSGSQLCCWNNACDATKCALLSVLQHEVGFSPNGFVACFGLEMSPISPLTKLGLGTRHIQAWTNSCLIDMPHRHVQCLTNTRVSFTVLLGAAVRGGLMGHWEIDRAFVLHFWGPVFPHRTC